MDYELFARDESFDYLSGELPDELVCTLGDQTERAQRILAGRSPEELDYGFESLDWLLREGGRLFERDILDGAYGDEVFINRTKALQAFQPRFELLGQKAFPNATWPEYFALLALACVGEQLFEMANARPIPPVLEGVMSEADATRQRERHLRDLALESMEAVCYAERLISEAALTARIDALSTREGEALRKAGRRGGQVRVAKYGELRAKLLAHYDRHHARRSNRGAAKLLYEHFQADVAATLHTDDPVQQIAKWIGQHRKTGQDTEASGQ